MLPDLDGMLCACHRALQDATQQPDFHLVCPFGMPIWCHPSQNVMRRYEVQRLPPGMMKNNLESAVLMI